MTLVSLGALSDRERYPTMRACAAAALGCSADREPRPWNPALANGINHRAAVASLLSEGAGILQLL